MSQLSNIAAHVVFYVHVRPVTLHSFIPSRSVFLALVALSDATSQAASFSHAHSWQGMFKPVVSTVARSLRQQLPLLTGQFGESTFCCCSFQR
jgi:hypothetical protein